MAFSQGGWAAGALAPCVAMGAVAAVARAGLLPAAGLWRLFQAASCGALALAALTLLAGPRAALLPGVVAPQAFGEVLAVLVQLLGTVIGAFSARYLQGEPGQPRYVASLAAVLAGVHLLLMADHWLVLIAAWSFVGVALRQLLCFYPDRPFALLAVHKKRIADRAADVLLLCAAALAWQAVGSGALPALWAHVALHGLSPALQASAVALVLAAVLRTALLPVHGWLTQVMEAPTPVSALLHAGVVNLGGFVLIRFAPMLDPAAPARGLLLVFGLATAVLAGLVMLTRVSIKVRLAWSTIAQMGFLLLECALGLYTLAALHLVGHSLYKAHAFLSASSVVRQTRSRALHGAARPSAASLAGAPVLATATVVLVLAVGGSHSWPWWWSAILGLAWAPLLWWPGAPAASDTTAAQPDAPVAVRVGAGLLMVAGLTVAAALSHMVPLGIPDAPHPWLGQVALAGMATLYLLQALLQRWPERLERGRRWSYAGFYLDEAYTNLALRIAPARWTPRGAALPVSGSAPPPAAPRH